MERKRREKKGEGENKEKEGEGYFIKLKCPNSAATAVNPSLHSFPSARSCIVYQILR